MDSKRPITVACVLGLVMLGVAVIASTYRDYGISWDEPVQSQFGERVVAYFASGGEDRAVNEFHHMRFYGPLFEFATALLYSADSQAKYEIRHFVIAVSGLLAVLGLVRLASQLPGRSSVVYAALALATMPRFYGHAFVNSKDIPFACGFVWTVVCLLALAKAPRSWPRAVAAGAALGLALAIRPGGLPLLALMHVAILAVALWSRGETGIGSLAPAAGRSAAVWGIAWVGMVAFWPWAHESPIAHPLLAIRAALSFPDTFPVLYEGQITMSDALSRGYLAKYLLITTPPAVLLLSTVGVVASVRAQRRGFGRPEALVASTLQLWLLIPLVIVALGRPNIYDGIRHFLFVLPVLAMFAAWGAASLLEAIRKPRARAVASIVLGLVLAWPAIDLYRLHPYQMTYFNRWVGGVEGATGSYETDYWLLSYREAMEWVNERARDRGEGPLDVIVAIDEHAYECAAWFASPDVRIQMLDTADASPELPAGTDYFIATTRYGQYAYYPESPVVHRITREGGVFSIIRGR
ncbi:MAG: hypothetical protein GY733_18650 [bacterium]|nr:hypothetical protein [bacterium]